MIWQFRPFLFSTSNVGQFLEYSGFYLNLVCLEVKSFLLFLLGSRSFEERERKWMLYSAGEELFGLEVTEYPELVTIKKQLKLLSSLYELYSDVINFFNLADDQLWTVRWFALLHNYSH